MNLRYRFAVAALFAIASHLGAGSLAHAADAASCQTTCTNFVAEHDRELKRCNGLPEAERAACHTVRESTFSQIKENCAGVTLTGSYRNKLQLAAGVFAMASTTCLVSCFSMIGNVTGICESAQYGTMVVDTVGAKFLGQEFSSGGLGGIVQGYNLLKVAPGLKNAFAKREAKLKEEVAEKLHMKQEHLGSCVSGAVFLKTSIEKYRDARRSVQSQENLCQTVVRYESQARSNAAAPTQAAQRRTLGQDSPHGARSGLPSGEAAEQIAQAESFAEGGSLSSAALASDPDLGLLTQLPGRDSMKDILGKLGLTPGDFIQAARSGSPGGPAALVGQALSGKDATLAQDLREYEKHVLASPEVGSARYAGASTAAPATNEGNLPALDFSAFGLDGGAPAVGAGTEELDFAKRSPASIGSSDIWHSGFPGTLFDIVSQRLGASRERVHRLEWATPLNRALTR